MRPDWNSRPLRQLSDNVTHIQQNTVQAEHPVVRMKQRESNKEKMLVNTRRGNHHNLLQLTSRRCKHMRHYNHLGCFRIPRYMEQQIRFQLCRCSQQNRRIQTIQLLLSIYDKSATYLFLTSLLLFLITDLRQVRTHGQVPHFPSLAAICRPTFAIRRRLC